MRHGCTFSSRLGCIAFTVLALGVCTGLRAQEVKEERYEQQIRFLEERMKSEGQADPLLLARTRVHMKSQRWHAARRDLNRLLRRDPSNTLARTMLADILLSMGKSKQAAISLRAVLRDNPSSPYATQLLARAERPKSQGADSTPSGKSLPLGRNPRKVSYEALVSRLGVAKPSSQMQAQLRDLTAQLRSPGARNTEVEAALKKLIELGPAGHDVEKLRQLEGRIRELTRRLRGQK